MNNDDHNLRFWLTKHFDILPNPLRFYRNLNDFQNFPQNFWDFVSKYGALMFFFSKFFMKNSLLSCTWLVKKRKFCQNYTLLWAKKVNRMPFISDFTKKSLLSCPYFVKNVHSLKTNSSHVHILSKKRPLSKNKVLSCHFFIFFYKNPIL